MAEFETRTTEFFSQNVGRLKEELLDGLILALPETTVRARIVGASAFPKKDVGKRYKDWGMEDLTPGDLWSPPTRRILQSLVVSQDEEGVGACVRLMAVAYWDSLTERFVDRLIMGGQEFRQTREGDIAKFFGLHSYERSELKFLDYSNILYIVREDQIYNKKMVAREKITPEEANRELEKLLENNSNS